MRKMLVSRDRLTQRYFAHQMLMKWLPQVNFAIWLWRALNRVLCKALEGG